MKKNTYMPFEEKSMIYIWSKFQLDTCMFDSNILLTKFGPGFWFRIPGIGPGFYPFPSDSIFSSPEPKAHLWAYRIGSRPSACRPNF